MQYDRRIKKPPSDGRCTRYFQLLREQSGGVCLLDYIWLCTKGKWRKRAFIKKEKGVNYVIHLMPLHVINIITREKEPEILNYDYIKNILLNHKLSPDEFRLKFFSLKKEPSANFLNFPYEIKVYFQQWIEGLQIDNFEVLSELIADNQIRRNLTAERKTHFVEELLKIKKIDDLVNKLNMYKAV